MKKIPFGDYLYEFHCDPKLTESALDFFLKSDIHWLNPESMTSGYMDEKHTVPCYHEELFNWIQQCVDQVTEEEVKSVKLAICDSWLTRSKFGQTKPVPHHHINSVLSGIFYFTSHPKTKTIFYKHKSLALLLEKMFFHMSLSNYRLDFFKERETISSESVAGKLIIFHSNIDHSITTNTDMKNTRYTLAFNTFPTGIAPTDGETGRLEFHVKTSKEKYLEYMSNKGKNDLQ